MNDLNLDQRDRLSIIFAVTLVLCVLGLLYYIPTGPRADYQSALGDLENLEADLQLKQLEKMEEEDRLASQQELMGYLDKRPAGFNLLTFIERKLAEKDLKARASLEAHRPRGASPRMPMYDLEIENVGLEELVDFFKEIYASENLIALYRMNHLEPARSGKGLRIHVTLVTLKPEG